MYEFDNRFVKRMAKKSIPFLKNQFVTCKWAFCQLYQLYYIYDFWKLVTHSPLRDDERWFENEFRSENKIKLLDPLRKAREKNRKILFGLIKHDVLNSRFGALKFRQIFTTWSKLIFVMLKKSRVWISVAWHINILARIIL